MTIPNPQVAIGQLAAEHPSLARVFDRLGLDYCCRGRMPLDRACADARLDLDEVLHELDASADPEVEPGPDAQSGPALGPLIDRIVELHGRLRSELSQLAELAGRVASAHGVRDPKLRGVAHELGEFRAELESHLDREESSLFPILRQLDAARDQPAGSEGRLGDPIRVPEREHWTAAAALGRLRVLTNDYTAPVGACAPYRTLLEGLVRLDADLRRSIHEENNILYPRARATGSAHPDPDHSTRH